MCKPRFLIAPGFDARENLARDEFVLNELAPGEIVLYLYVNKKAVIIGRNQNPYTECDLAALERDGVQLARRVSGGGAVYHDRGNLNYSFIAHRDIYDEARQMSVILKALEKFGIRAEVSGRNDLSAYGLKFSGNAFCKRGENCQHHGTLLINSELNVFSRYLTPSKLKLESKGIKSVRARVCNLNELCPGLRVEKMADALKQAFEEEYGRADALDFDEKQLGKINELYKKRSAWDWTVGEAPAFDAVYEGRTGYGELNLCLSVKDGFVSACKVYTDSLDTELPNKLSAALTGVRFDRSSLNAALESSGFGELKTLIAND